VAKRFLSGNDGAVLVYEEGTWTPGIRGSAGTFSSVTYVVQTGTYTRIGNQVTVYCDVEWSAASGGSGNMMVTNLPFTPLTTELGYVALRHIAFTGADYVLAEPVVGNNRFQLLAITTAGAQSRLTVAVATSGSFSKYIKAKFTYTI
jgi:hypothetical protein